MAFAVDLHTHTRFGSNCSYMEPGQLVRRAREVGLDAVCITEHNTLWEEEALRALAAEGGVRVLGGIEVSTELGDVLVFGVRDSLLQGRRIGELRRLVDDAGGVMIAVHPFRWYSLPWAVQDVEEAARQGIFGMVDAAEAFNGLALQREAEFACRVLERVGLRGVGGSDAHVPQSVGRCYTEFEREIGSVQELARELKAGRFRAVYPTMGLVL
ncbi:MAG: PHP domain-containing protein [Dehalococcoidia bacterium]